MGVHDVGHGLLDGHAVGLLAVAEPERDGAGFGVGAAAAEPATGTVTARAAATAAAAAAWLSDHYDFPIILLGLIVVVMNLGEVPHVIAQIIEGAFGIREFVTGGVAKLGLAQQGYQPGNIARIEARLPRSRPDMRGQFGIRWPAHHVLRLLSWFHRSERAHV